MASEISANLKLKNPYNNVASDGETLFDQPSAYELSAGAIASASFDFGSSGPNTRGFGTVSTSAGQITGSVDWMGEGYTTSTQGVFISSGHFLIDDVTIPYRGVEAVAGSVAAQVHVTTSYASFGRITFYAGVGINRTRSRSVEQILYEADHAVTGAAISPTVEVLSFNGTVPVGQAFPLFVDMQFSVSSRRPADDPMSVFQIAKAQWSVALGGLSGVHPARGLLRQLGRREHRRQ